METNNLKGGNDEMIIKEESIQIKFRNACPFCKKLLGQQNSENQAIYNLKIHLEKHFRMGEINKKQYEEYLVEIENDKK